MNNEAQILARAILAILENYTTNMRLYISSSLEEIEKYNALQKGEEVIIKDDELQKIIKEQEKILDKRIDETFDKVHDTFSNNTKNIKTIKTLLYKILWEEEPEDSSF